MPLLAAALPLTAPPDPTGDPPASIDPLGTLFHASTAARLDIAADVDDNRHST